MYTIYLNEITCKLFLSSISFLIFQLIIICKKEVACTRLGHVLLQGCSAWIDEAQLSEVKWTKVRNPKKVCKRLFSEKEDLGHVKCRYRIIDRLISIEVLWELSYPNTPINCEL